MGIPDDGPDELLGLYVGRSIQGHSFFDAGGELPDRVYIYRGPILRACGTKADVIREVQDTVVHEIGHHFGLSDEDMPV
jgi:predicted Zn-dependent protease with MMP-like domain